MITDIPGILVGHAQNEEALTGCTAILFEGGDVCSVDVRDLHREPGKRPDRKMGYGANSAASGGPFAEGNAGAGCRDFVGKLAGFQRAMKSGLGTASLHLPNGLIIGAMMAVNAVGEIRNPENGERVAGILGGFMIFRQVRTPLSR